MKHLEPHLGQLFVDNRVVKIEKARVSSDLFEARDLAEGILQNDIEDGLANGRLAVDKVFI
jgi:hypothetical protein